MDDSEYNQEVTALTDHQLLSNISIGHFIGITGHLTECFAHFCLWQLLQHWHTPNALYKIVCIHFWLSQCVQLPVKTIHILLSYSLCQIHLIKDFGPANPAARHLS